MGNPPPLRTIRHYGTPSAYKTIPPVWLPLCPEAQTSLTADEIVPSLAQSCRIARNWRNPRDEVETRLFGPVLSKDMQNPPPQKWPYLHEICECWMECWVEWKIIHHIFPIFEWLIVFTIYGDTQSEPPTKIKVVYKWPNLQETCSLLWQWFFSSWVFFCATFSFWDMVASPSQKLCNRPYLWVKVAQKKLRN